jgi:hypothetical protein
MKFWIAIIVVFFTFAYTAPLVAQSGKELKAIKKEEKKDLDSLFLVYSLPVCVTHSKNFTEIGIEDSLIALLKEKKYKHINTSDYEKLVKTKLAESMPSMDPEGIKEMINKTERDKYYYVNLIESGDPYAQNLQLSFLKNDSGINYINVKRWNLPKARKLREWIFIYQDSETSGQLASRILDMLIKPKAAQ